MTSRRGQLTTLIDHGAIPDEKINAAVELSGIRPDRSAWRLFIDRLMLVVGGIALAVAVLFFIAYNWTEIGRFGKFALVQLLILVAMLGYWKFGAGTTAGKVSLLVGTILLGVLLALYGQTYQTGADPWQLFFNWALLMLPWALVARFSAIWVVWLALINLSIVLYFRTFGGVFGIFFRSSMDLLWLIAMVNAAALLAWEYLASSDRWLDDRWALRLVALACGTTFTWMVLWSIFDYDEVGAMPAVGWAMFAGGVYLVYRHLRRDLFMLAGLCLSGIVVFNSFLVKTMLNEHAPVGFLVIALVIIGMAAGSAFWLRKVNKAWQT